MNILENLFYIGIFDTLVEVARIFVNNPRIVNLLLKFIIELVDSKGCRIADKHNSIQYIININIIQAIWAQECSSL